MSNPEAPGEGGWFPSALRGRALCWPPRTEGLSRCGLCSGGADGLAAPPVSSPTGGTDAEDSPMSWAPPLRPPAEGVVAREAGVTHGPGSPRRTLGQVRPGTGSLPGRSTQLCSQPPGCSTVALTEQRLRPHRKGSGGLIFIEARQSQRLWLGWVLSASCDPPAVCARKAGMLGSRERLPPAGRRAVHPCVGGQ